MSSNDKKNELTDIRSLPALDEDNEETFESLDDLAQNLGLGLEELQGVKPPALPDSPPDFNFESEESSLETENSDEEDEGFESNDFNTETFDDDFTSTSDSEVEDLNISFTDSENDLEAEYDSDFKSDSLSSDLFESESEFDNNEFNSDQNIEDDFEAGEPSRTDTTEVFNEDQFEEEDTFTITQDKSADSTSSIDENESAPNFSPSDIETDFAPLKQESTIESDIASSFYTPTTIMVSTEELSSPNLLDKSNDIQKTEIIRESITHNTPPEEFEDFKSFADNMVMENFSSEGNPPFSIILKSIKYHEDIQEITSVLLQHKIIPVEEKDSTVSALTRGQYLIPRLSEYAAIYLCHQLRRFDLEILMGLTEEINPPKNYHSNDRGPTSKRTLISNRRHDYKFDGTQINNEVITTTLSSFNDFQIRKYIGIITESKNVSPDQLSSSKNLEHEISNQSQPSKNYDIQDMRLERENLLASKSEYNFDAEILHKSEKTIKKQIGLEHIYSELVTNLKTQAKQSNANAIVGINFAITPVSIEDFLSTGPQYQILCTGNMVWIEKN